MSKDFGQFYTKDEYIWKGHLILHPSEAPKWRQTPGGGGPGDRVMEIEIRAPRSLWDIPSMRATVTVSDKDQPPLLIDTQAAAAALRAVVGADVRIEVAPPEVDEE